jgi:predicted nucleotidyltransferase
VFSSPDRAAVLDQLIAHARAEPTVTAAAVVGSAARHQTDRWSDIDLALRLEPGTDPVEAADAWSRFLRLRQPVADQLDLWSGAALYRVFLLADSLQVDLSFWPAADFASTGEPFELIFGDANPAVPTAAPDPRQTVGWGWLYALHARSAIARGRSWQAVQMLQGLRDQVITLACLRHDVPAHQGRGVDQLPGQVLTSFDQTLVRSRDRDGLVQAFSATVALLLAEVEHLDGSLAGRLRPPLTELATSLGSVAPVAATEPTTAAPAEPDPAPAQPGVGPST